MMKMITKLFSIKPLGLFTLLSVFLGGVSTNAQTLLSENFNTNPPIGWVATDISDNGVNWVFDNPGSRSIAGGSPGFDGNFAILDSDEECGSDENASLETPAFNASSGTIILEFDNSYRAWGTPIATVDVWNGTSWTTVLSINTASSDGYPDANHKTIDITSATGASASAKVRFLWDNGSCDYWWAIDNVTITRLNCISATATFSGNLDCANDQFYVDANITDMGSASSLQVTDDQGSAAQTASSTGIVTMGPYAYGTEVTLTVTNGDNQVCNISSDPISYEGCPPTNDECVNAIAFPAISTDGSCASVTANTEFASQSMEGCAGNADDDVWYSFVCPEGVDSLLFTITNVSGSTDVVIQFFSGACGNLTSLKCSDPENGGIGGLTPGETYYLRVYTYYSSEAEMNICLQTVPPPPANDDRNGATALTVNADYSCGAVTAGTTQSATASTPAPSCTVSGANDDVWFSFVATGAAHRVSLSNTSASSDMNMVVYESDGTTEVTGGGSCSNTSTKNLTGLTAGHTYYVRVYTYSSSVSTISGFNICVGTPPPPPANDDMNGATALTVNADYSCGTVTAGTTQSATASTPAPSCTVSGANDDVWFSFVAAGPAHRVSVSNISGSSDMNMVVYESDGATEVAGGSCDNTSTKNLTGLTAGNTYYVRVYTYSSSVSTVSNFNICIGTPPPPPSNDEASGAIVLTVGAGCTGTPYTNENATHSTGEPVNSCYQALTQAYPSVWFKFTAPASGAVKISTDYSGGSLSDTHLGLFGAGNAGDYNTFNIIACDDDNGTDNGGGSAKSILYATGLTGGNTYYVMVNGYNNQSGTFCVTVDELASSMLATSASCTSGQTLYARAYYTGQSSLVDDNGNLIAIVKRNTAGTGTGTNSYSNSLNINTGVQRADAYGVPYLDRNYRITYSESSPSSDFDVQFFFLNTELSSLGADLSELNISRVEGNSCIDDFAGVATLLTQNNNGNANGISWINVTTPGFSNFFVHAGSVPLPIKLGDIAAKNNGAVNDIAWNTLEERQGDYFELERGIEGKGFVAIATIEAQGLPAHYTYTDANPVKGINYYRLHLLNNDGNGSYSKVVAATLKTDVQAGVNVFPNPTSGDITVRINGNISGRARIIITDISGKVVNTINNINVNDVTVSMTGLSVGLYFVKYTDDNFTQTVKVTKR